jgi:adenosylmethionine-8-amino-7-oxononanoate aminotransferase
MAKQPGGSMGGTYSGNAVACAAAIATLEVLLAMFSSHHDYASASCFMCSMPHIGI